jgi:maltose alpha-D-glucosyltransferase/alpha-amylase
VADMWWKNAVVYCLDVETFADSDGDGVGDFGGLIEHVSHLAGLGVTCLWLMPFYPTEQLDDGYDVTEHYGIDERLGDFGDFTEFITVANEHGIRVIADLVVNHTSDQHPWFQAARRSRDSPFRDFYVWRDEVPDDGPHDLVFPGQQESVWTWDPEADQYYLHRFYRHQPDLNIASPRVRNEIRKVIGFWLAQGLSGFRVDAVPYLLETTGIDREMEIEPHQYLRDLRAFVQRRRGDAILLGEVNLPYDEARPYFGDEDGDEIDMLFDFVGNQHLFLALARKDATPIVDALRARPALAQQSTFATFVRNHDELNLNRLSDDECAEVIEAFGPDPDMQLFGRGLRRRLPTMLDGDGDRIRLVYSLLFALPGTPTLFYGEEIGMGENLDVAGRMAVRTPMQWQDGAQAGFTAAPPDALVRPVPSGPFGPEEVNVQRQRRESDSLLSWFERLIRLRKEHPEIGWGQYRIVDCDDPAVLALRFDWNDVALVAIHHLADRATTATIRLESGCAVRDLWGSGTTFELDDDGTVTLDLTRYDHLWLRVQP